MRWTVWRVLALGACGIACEDSSEVPIEEAAARIDDTFCERHFGCGCDYTFYDNDRECSSAAESWVETIQSEGELQGLEYRPECIGGWLERIDEAGCRPPAEQQATCVRPCSPYVGRVRRGERCEYLTASVSQCAAGLSCIGGTCQDPCAGWTPDVVAGLPDLTADGEPCMGHRECRSGYCPAAFCAPIPKLGESCRGTDVCAEGLDCRDDVCKPADAEVCGLSIPPDDL